MDMVAAYRVSIGRADLPMIFRLLAGCATDPSGTWLFTVEVTEAASDACTTTVTHNMVDAHEPASVEADPAWTATTERSGSPRLVLGRVAVDGLTGVLIVGDRVFPGSGTEAGAWTFAWTTSSAISESESHSSGYVLRHEAESEVTERVAGTFTEDAFSGTWESTSAATEHWNESDTWSVEAGASVGQHGDAPTVTYLVFDDEASESGTVPAENSREILDCTDSECVLDVSTACVGAPAATGARTSLEGDDGAWASDAEQPAGMQ
jgi:hypothetical protein